MTSSDCCCVAMPPLNISECCQIRIFAWVGTASEAIVDGLVAAKRTQRELAILEDSGEVRDDRVSDLRRLWLCWNNNNKNQNTPKERRRRRAGKRSFGESVFFLPP